MIKEIINIFKKDSLMDQAYERTYEMIDITFNMYKEIENRLRDNAKYKFSFDIRDQDIAINKRRSGIDCSVLASLLRRQGFGSAFWFAQRDWHPRSVERSRCRPDQGEDNPNRKGVAGNGRV